MGALRRWSGTGFGGGGFDVGEHGVVGGVDGVGFGCESEVDDGLREGEAAFRLTEEVHGVAGGEAEVERFGGGEADVFDGHADDAARDVHGVFAGLEHAREPVECGVGIGVANALMQGGDDVVVLLAFFVVEQDAALHGFGSERLGDEAFAAAFAQAGSDFERVEGVAGVAAGVGGDGGESVVVGFDCRCCRGRALCR